MKPISILLASLVLCFAFGVSAQTGDDKKAEAQTHYKRALAYEDLEQWTNAIAEYEAAHRLFPNPEFHYLIAELRVKLGEKEKAIDRYERYLKASPTGRVHLEAKAAIARLQAELATASSAPTASPAPSAPSAPKEAVEATGSTVENPSAVSAPAATAEPTTETAEPTPAPSLPLAGNVLPAAVTDSPADEREAWRNSVRTGGYVATGLGVGLLATGLYLASGESESSTGAKLAIGAGAVGVAAGIALFVVHFRTEPSPSMAALTPRFDGDVVALDLIGRF